jgi:luciferase family oxidoreductase group 1
VAELEGFAEVAPSAFPEDHPLHEVIASPEGVPFPPIWLLGSGQKSAVLAAEQGRGFAAAYHFGPAESEKAIRAYKAHFRPSAHLRQPYALASVAVICAESDEVAEGLKLASDVTTLRRQNGVRGNPPTVEEARAYDFTPEELEKIRMFAPIYGNPTKVHQELTELAAKLNADELIIVTNLSDHGLRRRSYELLAEVFDLRDSQLAEHTIGQPVFVA